MHARITTLKGDPARTEEAISYVDGTIIPGAKQIPGFTGGYWCADRQTGKMIAITLFETEEALKASEEAAEQLRTAGVDAIGAELVSVERFEVFAQA